jgi:hypothetical protein
MIRLLIFAAVVAAGSTSNTPAPQRIHDRPYYIAETTVCVWRQPDGRDLRCRVAPEREYDHWGECSNTEWSVVAAFADNAPAGYRVAARVRCVRSYDA